MRTGFRFLAVQKMERSELQALLATYDDSPYPDAFLADYVMMACLSDRNGITTLLVQDRDGNRFVAKCYDKAIYPKSENQALMQSLSHSALPKYITEYKNERMTVTVREYVDGLTLDQYARENNLSRQEIVTICLQLCDVLAFLHHRQEPIIHRDIKPQNIFIRPDGSLALIDFDIARTYRSGIETDTTFFGTIAYAPPEQYGFSQTDVRTDIYSFGILLRWLLTGSTRENENIQVYRPLAKIITKCTAFSPKERYSDISQVKKALERANPHAQTLLFLSRGLCVLLAAGLLFFAGRAIYKAATWSPFNSDAIPAALNDRERIADAVTFLNKKYGINLFENPDQEATMGLLRKVLIDFYGLDRAYVYASQPDLGGNEEAVPMEGEDYFFPWPLDDGQQIHLSIAVYAAVKVHDPALVADWSSLKDDNGEYPGARVAMNFAEKTGITTGANRPYDVTAGELALLFANADRVFDTAQSNL